MKTHNCPYLENGIYCTHKRKGSKKKHYCSYKNPEKCKLLNKSKSILRTALKRIRKRSTGSL